MPKKSGGRTVGRAQRKQVRRVSAPVASVSQADVDVEQASPTPAAPEATTYTARSSSPSQRRAVTPISAVPVDYSYVRHDLQRIGVLLVIISVVMGGLTVVLR